MLRKVALASALAIALIAVGAVEASSPTYAPAPNLQLTFAEPSLVAPPGGRAFFEPYEGAEVAAETTARGARTPATSSGFFIQSAFGSRGNFEAVVPGRTSGLAHLWRNNDSPGLPWSAPTFFATGTFAAASLIQSNLGAGLGLEVVARSGDQLLYFSRQEQPPFAWSGPAIIGSGVAGNPALIQGTFGTRGNFELVVPLAAGGLGHYWRDNDGSPAWHGPTVFGTSVAQINGVALIQSGFGDPGNLEVVATAGSGVNRSLVHFWRDASGWHGPTPIFLPAAFGTFSPGGTPGFVQSADGNFQVVVAGGGHLTHIERDNSDPSFAWHPVADFGGFPMTAFGAASLIQSNFGAGGGNLEVLARKNDAGPGVVHVNHFWRIAHPSGAWQGPGGDLLG